MSDYKTPVRALMAALRKAEQQLAGEAAGRAGMRLMGIEFGQRKVGGMGYYYVLTIGVKLVNGQPDPAGLDTMWESSVQHAWERQYEVILRPDTTA